MKFGQFDVFNLYVFNEDESLVTELNTLRKVDIAYSDAHETYFVIARDALLDAKLLRFIGKENGVSDLALALGNRTTISIGKTSNKRCKLVAKAKFRKATDLTDEEFTFEFPEVEVVSKPTFITDCEKVTEFDVSFRVKPQVDGEFYKIHI